MASTTSTPAAAASSGRSAGRHSAAGAGRAARPARLQPSPTRLLRGQEKEELRHLNDRLANYIHRVQELESERSSILLQLEEKDESKSREMGNVRLLYEEELADVRKSLDGLAGERARLQIDYGNLFEDYRKIQASCKDAEYKNLLSENRRLHNDFADLQGQLENVEGVLSETKNQLSSEILWRVDLENQVQTIKEQLELQRNITELEILEIRSCHESRLVEVESGRRREFEGKLSDTMQQLRQDHETQLQQYREELHRTFTSKKMLLEGSFHDLERTLDKEREVWQQRLGQKEQELLNIRSQMFTQLVDYENLLDVKLALDMEINAYRKMLEAEEQRYGSDPQPSQHSAVPRTHEHSSRQLRGKKRKHEGASGSHATQHSSVSVAGVDMDGKYIRLKNNSETKMAERRVCMQHRGDEETELFDEEYVAGSDIQHFRRQRLLLRSRSTYYEHGDKASRLLAHQLRRQAASRMILQIKDSSGIPILVPLTQSLAHSILLYTKDVCQRKWKSLRDTYVKEKKREKDRRSGSAAGPIKNGNTLRSCPSSTHLLPRKKPSNMVSGVEEDRTSKYGGEAQGADGR
ncbi:hypothetical protein F7725_026938, partial [Dissostichus mawsoni]